MDVVLVRPTITLDTYGDRTAPDPERTTISGALFDPDRAAEQVAPEASAVTQSGVWNLPGVYEVDANATIEVGTGPDLVIWNVDGAGLIWRDRTKVPVTSAREV